MALFDNYVYALEAATGAEGMVLAWRGFADAYLESGQLLPVHASWYASGARPYAIATRNGSVKPVVANCLRFFSKRLPE